MIIAGGDEDGGARTYVEQANLTKINDGNTMYVNFAHCETYNDRLAEQIFLI